MRTLGAGVRRLNLMLHVATSVGWIGAVAAFAVIAAFGVTLPVSSPAAVGVYRALDVVMWAVIVPLAVLSLLTGVLQAVGTPWGLFRHYWVIAKLVFTVGATALLLLHTRVSGQAADLAAATDPHLAPLQQQLLVDSLAAGALLLVIAALGWVKPKGRLPRRARIA